MSRAGKDAPHRARATPEDQSSDLLCLADQGSFMLLRALGRGPVLQCTWLFSTAPGEAAVNAFNDRLAKGLLGRLIQRSPLPWGRPRWVARPEPEPVTWFRTPLAAADLPAWRNALARLPVDPEHGPGWRLAAQPLEDGGYALSLLMSHTIVDAQSALQAIADAVAGRTLLPPYPAPSPRWSPRRLALDGVETLRALPPAARTLAHFMRSAKGKAQTKSKTKTVAAPVAAVAGAAAREAAEVPVVQARIAAAVFAARAAERGVAGNGLLAALAARIAWRMGRVDGDGRVTLVLPVSNRGPGDRRGNALESVTVLADPETACSNPRVLQRAIRSALASLRRQGDPLMALLPLLPFLPLRLLRHMERAALGGEMPVGCSFLGEIPAELGLACGGARAVLLSSLEGHSAAELDQRGGRLLVVTYAHEGEVFVTVCGYAPGRITTRAALAQRVSEALADLGLDGRVS